LEFGAAGRHRLPLSHPNLDRARDPCGRPLRAEGLGQWLNEGRDVYRDYGEKIGGALPTKIVRVWLIAVSLFQQTEGKCQYAGISFVSDDGVMPVL